jgi:hypothetical protein
VADGLVRALAAGTLGHWDELVLPAMAGDGVMPEVLASALEQAGLAVTCAETSVAPYIPLPPSWQQYLQTLPQRKRYVVVRAEREFAGWAGNTAELHRVRTRAELEEGKRILAALHQERWDAGGHAGVFAAPRFAAFHDAVLPRLLDEGALDLMWLCVRGEPVAAVYNLVWNDKVYFYQCGRKIDVPRNQRLGIVMLAHAIRAAIAAGRREFDFLAGPSQYKGQLMLASRPLVQLRAVRPSLRESTRRLADRGLTVARKLRQALRRPSSAPR